MDSVREEEQPTKRRTPAWLRSLAGRRPEPVIVAKGICPACDVIGPVVAYLQEIIFQHEPIDEYPEGRTESILFEGLKLKKCGHILVFLVTDDHVRRHLDVARELLATIRQYKGSGDISSALRADKKHSAAQQRVKSASCTAWRKYESVAPKGLIPIKALLK